MRFTAVLFLVIAVISISQPALSGSGCGSNWLGNDAVGYDPDFNYAANQRAAYSTPAVSLSTAAEKPRVPPDERPKGYPNPNPVNMSMPDTQPKPLDAADETEAPAEVEQVEPAPAPAEDIIQVGGKWSVSLDGINPPASLSLIILQSGESLMGSGTLTEGGKDTPMTLSGSVDGKDVKIKARSSTPEYQKSVSRQVSLDLTFDGETLKGGYEAYSGDVLLAQGNATATAPITG